MDSKNKFTQIPNETTQTNQHANDLEEHFTNGQVLIDSDTKSNEPDGSTSIWQTIREYAVSIGIAVVIALVVNNFILLNANIPSGSMENTIMTGDRVFGFRLSYLFSKPERGDIVIFKFPDDESKNFIKRVIGLPEETVTIRDGLVYINDSEVPLDEPYLAETPYALDFGPYKVPKDHYFMLGDNRNHSSDSRAWKNTFVSEDKILAKAFLRYWKGFRIYSGHDYE